MSGTSPLDELERQISAARHDREVKQQTLERTPRRRFRRRRHLERSLRRRRAWESELRKSLEARSTQQRQRIT